jgi:uncharacterized membrane protein YjjP (DUF1212 family)
MLKPVHFLPMAVILGLIGLAVLTLILPQLSKPLWGITLIAFIFICLLAFFQSLFKYKNLKTSFLSIITLNIQVFAYGFGLIWGLLNALKGKEVKGFSKNYYGKKDN